MKNTTGHMRTLGALAIVMAMTGCGGGGSYSSTTTPTPPPNNGGGITGTGSALSASGPITVSGSGALSVGGVALTASSSTTVRIDDRSGTLAEVKDGMTGKVRGRINDDRVTGTAEAIEIENEVRGPVANVNATANPKTFDVNGQKVYEDAQTVYANLANFAAITNGTNVEVHGLRDSTGAIRATRIEAVARVAGDDEIRGTVSSPGANSFLLGSVTVSYSGTTTFSPTGQTAAALVSGAVVEVHGTFSGASTFTATRIDLEDAEDTALNPGSGDDAEVEGFVSGFSSLTASFKVGTRTVVLSTSTAVRYEGGTSADLGNDTRVEVEGSVSAATGVLTATKVQFKSTRVLLQYRPSAVDPVGKTLTLLTSQVVVSDLTRLDTLTAGGANSSTLSDIVANSDCIEVRGALSAATLIADEVKELGGGGCKAIVQARAAAKTTSTVTLLGLNVDLGAAVLKDASGAAMTLTQFLAAITANANTGTLVKAKGSLSGATLVAEEAELEN